MRADNDMNDAKFDRQLLRLVWFAILCAVAGLLITHYTDNGESDTGARCTEDMACWDCETMGNQVCGTDR